MYLHTARKMSGFVPSLKPIKAASSGVTRQVSLSNDGVMEAGAPLLAGVVEHALRYNAMVTGTLALPRRLISNPSCCVSSVGMYCTAEERGDLQLDSYEMAPSPSGVHVIPLTGRRKSDMNIHG